MSTSVLTSCSDCVKGKGETEESIRSVGAFTGVQMSMSADVVVYQDSTLEAPQVKVFAQDNILEKITTKIQGGILVLDTDGCLSGHKDIRFEVRNPSFELLKIDGSGDIESGNVISGDQLSLVISGSGDISVTADIADMVTSEIAGSGDIHLSGDADRSYIDINGSGDINAFDLATRETNVNISGSGDARVRAYESLNVVINGSGDVLYRGNPPNINIDNDGSGSVKPD